VPSAAAVKPEAVTIQVPNDTPIEVVFGPKQSQRVIVYLHGVCGDPLAFESWVGAAARHATFISLRGDQKCRKRPGRFKWSYNYQRNNKRITAAIEAAAKARGAALDTGKVVLMGYSQGAGRTEAMARRFPDRYRRIAIIAIVSEPRVANLRRADAVLLMAGSLDAHKHIQDGANKLARAGKRVRYIELPGARHGEYGDEAPRVMRVALDWLLGATP